MYRLMLEVGVSDRVFNSFIQIQRNPQIECLAYLARPPQPVARRYSTLMAAELTSEEESDEEPSNESDETPPKRMKHGHSTSSLVQLAPAELDGIIASFKKQLGPSMLKICCAFLPFFN